MTAIHIYRAVRRSGHGWFRALRCVRDVRNGQWEARDAGEMRAQARLMADVIERAS